MLGRSEAAEMRTAVPQPTAARGSYSMPYTKTFETPLSFRFVILSRDFFPAASRDINYAIGDNARKCA
jgi:hypothetical protein